MWKWDNPQDIHRLLIRTIKSILDLDNITIYEPLWGKASKWKRVYETKGYKCEICGYDDIVEIHHKDPVKGNALDNLMVLCPNHHALLHANRVSIKGYNR